MNEPQDVNYIDRIQKSFAQQKFMDYLGASLAEIKPGYCEITLPYRTELSQQHGYFHAGVIGTLADNSSGYAAYTLMKANSSVLTVEFKLNLLSPAVGDHLIARAQVLKAGKTLTICRADVFVRSDNIEKLCAAAQVTLIELPNTNDGK